MNLDISVPEEETSILEKIFKNYMEEPSSRIDRSTFRARNGKKLRLIDHLEKLELIKTYRGPSDVQVYRVSLIGLHLIDDNNARDILKFSKEIYEALQREYANDPYADIELSYLSKLLGSSKEWMSIFVEHAIDIIPLAYWSGEKIRAREEIVEHSYEEACEQGAERIVVSLKQGKEGNIHSNMNTQAFVAMWFHKDLDKVYSDGIQAGISQAGYEPIRIDRVEHVNKIDDEIIKQIRSSKFVVADFTGHRGGVYFEAGFAYGLGIPIFWTCRNSDMDELHFDIRQFNCIGWDSPGDLAYRLATRLEAVLGPGPQKQ